MNYADSPVLITGGSKGIGLSIAKVFSRFTDRTIILLARNRDELEAARKQCLYDGAKKVRIIVADITRADELEELKELKPAPGILINNAGSFLFKNLEDTDQEEFTRQYEINTLGAFNVTSTLLDGMKATDRGLIVNICSQASLKGLGDSGAYAMSKHALLGYTRSLRLELMDTQIAVTALNLGQTWSTSWEGVDIAPDKLIDPEDVGQVILMLSRLSKRSVVEELLLKPQGGEVDPM